MCKLSMSQFTTIHCNFEEDIKLYSRMGFDGVEIFEGKLKKEKQGFEAQMELLRTSGLTISAVQPEIRTILPSKMQPMPKELLSRQLRLQETITKLSPWCHGVPFIINTGIAIDGNIKASTKAIIEFITNILPVVKKEQVTLSLEPLNPISMNHESFIWTIDQALHIIKEINDSSLGLCLDLWNIWQNQDIVKAISRAIPYTNVLQISDWHTPRAEMDRLIPGEGEIPLKKLLTLIKSKGYHGFCTVEIFSETLNHKPVETVERSYNFLREYWL